jgi:predicted DNA-binding protein (MmcQ/YjbR family)
MDLEIIQKYCLSFPGASEQIQWEESLLFKVGGKIFVIYNLGIVTNNRISLKCTEEKFQELVEMENIIPAPYLARNKWVALQDGCRLKIGEIKKLIEESYNLVFIKLPKKTREGIKPVT